VDDHDTLQPSAQRLSELHKFQLVKFLCEITIHTGSKNYIQTLDLPHDFRKYIHIRSVVVVSYTCIKQSDITYSEIQPDVDKEVTWLMFPFWTCLWSLCVCVCVCVCVCISQYPFGRCISDTNGDSLYLAQNLFVVGRTGKLVTTWWLSYSYTCYR